MLFKAKRKHTKKISPVKLSSSLVSANVFFSLPLKRQPFKLDENYTSEIKKSSEEILDDYTKDSLITKRPCIRKVIVPLTNKSLSINCTQEEKEAIRMYVNSNPGNFRDPKYWEKANIDLTLNYTADILRRIYVQYYEEKLKQNEAQIIKMEEEPFDGVSNENTGNSKFSIKLVPAPRPRAYFQQRINEKPRVSTSNISKSVILISGPESQEVASSIKKIKEVTSEHKILEKFKKLVEKCRCFVKSYLSEKEVLEILTKNHGDTKSTLEHFQLKFKSNVI